MRTCWRRAAGLLTTPQYRVLLNGGGGDGTGGYATFVWQERAPMSLQNSFFVVTEEPLQLWRSKTSALLRGSDAHLSRRFDFSCNVFPDSKQVLGDSLRGK